MAPISDPFAPNTNDGDDVHCNPTDDTDVEMTPMDSTHVAASLPSLDDVVVQKKPLRRRRWMGGTALLLLVLIIGVSVGVTTTLRKDRSSSHGSNNLSSNTLPPNSFSLDDLTAWLVDHAAIASTADVGRSGSPQHLAAAWLANEDRYMTQLPTDTDTEYTLIARYALVVLYYTWAGTTWESRLGFLDPTTSVCEWHGLGIGFNDQLEDIEPEYNGVFCADGTEWPVAIDLELNNLHGPIPAELGLLTTLQAIDIEYNTIQGTLPTELCWLTQLHHLWAQSNQLSGTIPACFAPTPLLGLNVQDNPDLHGVLPEAWCDMTQLQSIVLDRCGFSGTLPDCAWSELQILSVSDNLLTGTLPVSLGGLAQLREVYVDGNSFEGNPLPIVTRMAALDMLYLEENFFTGSIDEAFATALPSSIRALDVSENQFTLGAAGTVPTQLLSLPDLAVLDLSQNQLAGSIPDTITTAQNSLVFFSVHQNRMTGPIPTSLITNLGTLHHLDLSNNGFTGTIPPQVFQRPQLFQIFLAENPGLTAGPIPDSITGATQLQELSLKNTNRNGPLPPLLNFHELHILDLDDNAFTGTIPSNYGQLLALRHLLLNSNPGLIGTLPPFTTTYNLGTVLLDKTGVTGDFNSICNLPTFQGIQMIDTETIVIADCANDDSAIACDCCHCCTREQALCSDPQVASLDWTWESGFVRYGRDFALNHTRLEKPKLTP